MHSAERRGNRRTKGGEQERKRGSEGEGKGKSVERRQKMSPEAATGRLSPSMDALWKACATSRQAAREEGEDARRVSGVIKGEAGGGGRQRRRERSREERSEGREDGDDKTLVNEATIAVSAL